jgi:hypothetical protein
LTNKQLNKWFRAFNSRFFAGRVPAEVLCRFRSIHHAGDDACTWFLNNGDIWILVDTQLRSHTRVVAMALLHEMIHALGIRGHGEKFDKEMRRLLKYKHIREYL